MSVWLWVNLCLGALFVLAIVGVPLWLVLTRPDTGPDTATAATRRRVRVFERAAAMPAWRRPTGQLPRMRWQHPAEAARPSRPNLDQA